MRKYPKLARVVLLLLLGAGTGCYHYTVEAPRRDPATEWRGRTVWSFLWGALQSSPVPADGREPSNAIDQVREQHQPGLHSDHGGDSWAWPHRSRRRGAAPSTSRPAA
jgi:hypothetical protein